MVGTGGLLVVVKLGGSELGVGKGFVREVFVM